MPWRLDQLSRRLRLPRLPWPTRRRAGLGSPGGVLSGTAPYAAWEAELTAYARWRSGSRDVSVVFGLGTETGWTETVRLARPASRDPRVAFSGAELELEHLLAHYRHGWREAVLAFHAWSQPGEPVSLPWPPWDQVSLPAAVVRQAVGEAIPALVLPPAAETWSVRHRTAVAWMVAAWADGLHRALEVAERPGMAERLPVAPAPGGSPHFKGARIEGRRTWEGALYRLATPQEPAPEGLREALGERASAGLEGLLRLGPDDLQALVSGALDVVDSLRQRSAVPPGPEQHPRWLRRDWGRWRREAALRAALDHLARSPSSVAVAVATAAGRLHASLPAANGAPSGATVALRRTTTGPSPAAGRDESGRGERAQDGPEDRHPAEDWAPPQDPALPDAGPAGSGGEGGQREGSERDGAPSGGPSGGQGTGGSGPGALGALKVVAPSPEDRAAYWQLRGALAPEIERLIERLQAAGDRYYEATPRRFQRAGRVDRNRLPAALAGREAVFARFVHRPAPANALCLLLDCSASMAPYAEQLREASILIESAATAVGARVSAFTFGAAWERLEPPAEGAPLVALGRELRPQGGTPFGPAVAAAAAWLGRQPYARRRLWVLSDGQWSARDRAAAAGRPDLLRDVLVWVFADTAPDPPTPALRIVAARTLEDLIRIAPDHFWGEGLRGAAGGGSAAGGGQGLRR